MHDVQNKCVLTMAASHPTTTFVRTAAPGRYAKRISGARFPPCHSPNSNFGSFYTVSKCKSVKNKFVRTELAGRGLRESHEISIATSPGRLIGAQIATWLLQVRSLGDVVLWPKYCIASRLNRTIVLRHTWCPRWLPSSSFRLSYPCWLC